jgi:hypothetical protein
MPGIHEAYRRALDVIAVIESAESATAPIEQRARALTAMAAVARCRSLLLAIIDLDRAGRGDVVGVMVRALLEVWYFGVIVVLGTDDDFERLHADHRYWKNELAKSMPGIDAEPGATKRFSVWGRAQRVDELVVGIGEQQGVALNWYRSYYAAESLSAAHAGFEALKPYVFEDADGGLGIVHNVVVAEDLRYGRLQAAAIWTLLLAKWAWPTVGLPDDAFDAIDF